MFKRIIFTVFLLITLFICTSFVVNAHTEYSLQTDGDTGWSFGWVSADNPNRHLGSITTIYYLLPSDNSMQNDLNDGISMWGNSINFIQYDDTLEPDDEGYIQLYDRNQIYFGNIDFPADAVAGTDEYEPYSNNHYSKWSILVDYILYTPLSDDKDHGVLAHEIGHVYGLGHVYDSYDIMLQGANFNRSVLSDSLAGMAVCTDSHTSHTLQPAEQYGSAILNWTEKIRSC